MGEEGVLVYVPLKRQDIGARPEETSSEGEKSESSAVAHLGDGRWYGFADGSNKKPEPFPTELLGPKTE